MPVLNKQNFVEHSSFWEEVLSLEGIADSLIFFKSSLAYITTQLSTYLAETVPSQSSFLYFVLDLPILFVRSSSSILTVLFPFRFLFLQPRTGADRTEDFGESEPESH